MRKLFTGRIGVSWLVEYARTADDHLDVFSAQVQSQSLPIAGNHTGTLAEGYDYKWTIKTPEGRMHPLCERNRSLALTLSSWWRRRPLPLVANGRRNPTAGVSTAWCWWSRTGQLTSCLAMPRRACRRW